MQASTCCAKMIQIFLHTSLGFITCQHTQTGTGTKACTRSQMQYQDYELFSISQLILPPQVNSLNSMSSNTLTLLFSLYTTKVDFGKQKKWKMKESILEWSVKSKSWIGKQKKRKLKENRFRMIGEIQTLTCETKAMEDEGKHSRMISEIWKSNRETKEMEAEGK
jgi:hypothetical protein